MAIRDVFSKAVPNGTVEMLTGDEPTEQAFRNLSPGANYIHLSVHGFYEQPRNAVGKLPKSPLESRTSEALNVSFVHPDLRCGLALVGALRPIAPNKDDGILTGLEVKALNLEKVDLVTLAACQSALGLQTAGEGVLGIQRAFQLAGARTTVATLWSISVSPADQLMIDFYENLLAKKMSKIESLRQAQLKVLREGAKELAKATGRPQDADKRLYPFYWAGFVLAGDWR